MTARQALLIDLVALTDAIWAPMRQPDWASTHKSTNFYLARRDFGTLGMSWVSGGAKAADRLASTRQLEELQAEGLASRSGSERKTRIKLTPRGDEIGRRLASMPDVQEALETMAEIERIGTASIDGLSVCELELARLPGYVDTEDCRRRMASVDYMLSPALWRGWVRSGSTMDGCVWYFLTPAGHEALAAESTDLGDLPDAASGGLERYCQTYHAERRSLRAASPDNEREIGFLPMIGCQQRGWKEP